MWKIVDVLKRIHPREKAPLLPTPAYTGSSPKGIGLAVESMKYHTTDEGWQIFAGLEQSGYILCGHQLTLNSTNVEHIIQTALPGVVVLQDKREWDLHKRDFREPLARFDGVNVLARHHEIFKVTILKDAHQRPNYHRTSAAEIDCHAWIIYYHPTIVKHIAPFVRPHHFIRTYHSIDANLVPAFSTEGRGDRALLSGAVSGAYPLRRELFTLASKLPIIYTQAHPGYHRNGCQTPKFLKTLSRFKVAICTSSIYGYALRKIPEATACGCVVLTDLPEDEVMPHIDGNLVRVAGTASPQEVYAKAVEAIKTYNPERQAHYADLAKQHYDYRVLGAKLADDIERLRSNYGR